MPKKKKIPEKVQVVLDAFNLKAQGLLDTIKDLPNYIQYNTDSSDIGITTILNRTKPEFNILLAPPMSGKKSLSCILTLRKGYTTIMVKDLVAQASRIPNERGKIIDRYLKSKTTIPLNITLELIKESIYTSENNKILIVGYPWCVSEGTPTIQEQVIALERLGHLRNVIGLEGDGKVRESRTNDKVQFLRDESKIRK